MSSARDHDKGRLLVAAASDDRLRHQHRRSMMAVMSVMVTVVVGSDGERKNVSQASTHIAYPPHPEKQQPISQV